MTELLYYIVSAIEAVSSKLASRSEKGFRLQCPAHKGKNRNLFIADGDNRILMTCHSHHCDPKDIMESVGLTIGDVFYEKLKPEQAIEYRAKVTTRKLIEELEQELVIITLWITDFSEGLYPRNDDLDRSRAKLAFNRIQKALKHLEILL